MKIDQISRKAVVVGAAVGAMLVGGMLSEARAAIQHQYTFNSTPNDSVGTANATLINGATVNATSLVTNGAVAGVGLSQAASLPAGSVTGINGDFTIEDFFTRAAVGNNFQTGFSFAGGAALSTTDYIIMSPNRAAGTGVMGVGFKQTNHELNVERILIAPTALIGVETYFATTYNATAGQATLYANGALRDGFQADYFRGFDLSAKTTRAGVSGNAPFGDGSLNGSANEFRIYDNVEGANTIALRFLGGNTANNPVVTNAATGSGNYNDALQYDNGVPTPTQDVFVSNQTMSLIAGTGTAGLLRVGAGGVVNVNTAGTLTSNTNVDLSGGGAINVGTGGTLSVRGVTGGGVAFGAASNGSINLTGGGTISTVAAAQTLQGIAYIAPSLTINNSGTNALSTVNGRLTVGATITGSGTLNQTFTPDLYLSGDISGFTGTFNVAPAVPTGGGAIGGITIFAPAARTSANPIAANFTLSNLGFLVFAGQNNDYVTGNITGGIPGSGPNSGATIRKTEFGTLVLTGINTVNGDIVGNGRSSIAILGGKTTGGDEIGLADNGVNGEVRKFSVGNATLDNSVSRYLYTDTGGNNETRYVEMLGNGTITANLPLYVKGRTTNETIAGMTVAARATSGIVLDNVAGTNLVAGGVSIRSPGGGYSIRSQAGVVTIGSTSATPGVGDTFNNVTDAANPNRILELTGGGNGIFAGLLRDGSTSVTTSRLGIAVIGGTDGSTTSNVGTWTLAALNNTFSGGLTVVNGTLLVDGTTTSASTIASNAANVYGGTLGGVGTLSQAITVFASGSTISVIPGQAAPAGTVAQTLGGGGTLAPGNAATPIGTLTTGRGAIINGVYSVQADGTGAGSADKLVVGTTLVLGTGSVLNVATLGAGLLDDGAYIIATYPALGLNGTFGTVNAPAGITVDYNYLGLNQIALVPEPATLTAIAGIAMMGLGRRRRA